MTFTSRSAAPRRAVLVCQRARTRAYLGFDLAVVGWWCQRMDGPLPLWPDRAETCP
jgi:hypothetical protein